MKKRTFIFLFFILIVNCSINMGSFHEIRMTTPQDKEEVSSTPVKGEHCKITLFFNFPRLDLAVFDAISKVPKAKGLKDAKISDYRAPYYSCIIVEGIPVK